MTTYKETIKRCRESNERSRAEYSRLLNEYEASYARPGSIRASLRRVGLGFGAMWASVEIRPAAA